MIIEGSGVAAGDTVEADVCIVGAGPAGLTIALELAATDLRVVILEAGGEHPTPEHQQLAGGDVVGHPYFELTEARGRALGGSSHLWEEFMRARPLDPIDMEPRRGVPYSGWPIELAELEPYYERAHDLQRLGPYDYRPETWSASGAEPMLTAELADVTSTVFLYGNEADFTRYRSVLDRAANLILILEASALRLNAADRRSVTSLEAAAAPEHRFRVEARCFVLAGGGIDNPRLLLVSNDAEPRGLGNEHDTVGRFFMEHLHVRSSVLVPRNHGLLDELDFYQPRWEGATRVRGALTVAQERIRSEGILNNTFLLFPMNEVRASLTFRSLAQLRESVAARAAPPDGTMWHLWNVVGHPLQAARAMRAAYTTDTTPATVVQLAATAEQAPNPASRVTLGSRKDRFGIPAPRLDWQLSDIDRSSIRQAEDIIDSELRSARLGRLEHMLGQERPPRQFRGHWHHIGTTRMSSDPREGVVDADLRVHGVDNLYVAGSSVFPTGGYANPTMTIVALSMRLADHLREMLGSGMGSVW